MPIATKHPSAAEYVLGDAPPQRKDYATFETKPPNYTATGKRDSGAGYERWRSYEYRPETRGVEKEDVYVAHHRLLAVIACYPLEMPIEEILEDLDGKDVHHNCPDVEKNHGVPWDNRHDGLETLTHGGHSKITTTQMRAWGEDAKRQAEEPPEPDEEGCVSCDDTDGPLATSEDFSGKRCISCATEAADGGTIDVGR